MNTALKEFLYKTQFNRKINFFKLLASKGHIKIIIAVILIKYFFDPKEWVLLIFYTGSILLLIKMSKIEFYKKISVDDNSVFLLNFISKIKKRYSKIKNIFLGEYTDSYAVDFIKKYADKGTNI